MRSLLAVAVVLLAGCATPGPSAPPPEPFDAIVVETPLGAFTAIVFCDDTPKTCAFMQGLVSDGYYDGRAFGRVIPGFVIQEVDRTGGTTDQTQRVEAEFGTPVMFSGGAFGIARDADPDSGGSEFFVMDHAASHLYGNFTAFAQVIEGMDVVHAIARVPAVRTGPASAAAAPPESPIVFGIHDRVPVEPVRMTRVAWTQVDVPADEAARYPLVVGETVRTDELRATLEWPRHLRAGNESELTWYVWGRDTTPTGAVRDPPLVDLGGLEVHAGSETIAPEVDEQNGVVRFRWSPSAAGETTLRLMRQGTELVAAPVLVPDA